MRWTAALQAVKAKLATARPIVKAAKHQTTNTKSSLLARSFQRPRTLAAGTVALFVIGGGTVMMTSHLHQLRPWLQVYRNGRYAGLVPDEHSVQTQMKRVADGYNVQFQTTPIHTAVAPDYAWQKVASFPTAAAVIELNNKPLVYTTSKKSASEVLGEVKQVLSAHVKKASQLTTSFVGDVKVAAATVGIADILQPEAAKRLLLSPQTNGPIAGRAATPKILLKPKNAKFAKPQPLLSVQSKATVTKTVSLPYHIKYVDDASMGVGNDKVVKAGKKGKQKESVEETFVNGQKTASHVISKKTVAQPVDEVVDKGTNNGIASGSWIWPTTGHIITSPFGWRSFRGGQFHPGVDIGVPIGSPIYATNNGVVISAGWNSGGYGNWVEIDNGNGITTVFGHMSRVVAKSGETVAKGELIGYSGESGDATGPHLHYEVRIDGKPVNPMKYT